MVFKILLPYTSSDKCEAGLSRLLRVKLKHRMRLTAQGNLLSATNTSIPTIKKLTETEQAKFSH
jgi:hypothetical protein